MRGLTFSLIAATAIMGLATLASAQPQQAGVSAAVRGQVALARVSENVVGRQVQSGDPIFLGDAITSGKSSGLQIMLLDETVFTIGPNSEIAIDEFVYDPETDTGKISASVAKGAFRFITGKIARKRPEDMTVRLPTATIGIRGTIVAGVVRSAPGDDPVADDLFKQLKKDLPGAENARDFVVLLGPGDENNTNDKGGAFVLAPKLPQQAMRGRSAGAQQAQQGGGVTPNDSLAIGIVFANAIRVSRTGSAAVGFEGGDPQGPFFVSDFARFFSRVFPTTIQGTVSANDPSVKEASGASDADSLSGNSIADSAAEGSRQAGLAEIGDRAGDIVCNTCGAGAAFDFNDLRSIASGTAIGDDAISAIGPFNLGASNFTINFGQQTMTFDIQVINGGGLASAQIGCFSGCSLDYSNLSGPASFGRELIAGQSNLTRVNCDNCAVDITVTSANSLNVTLDHVGVASGSATVPLND